MLLVVLRIVHDRVRVRTAAGLHVREVLRIVDVGDVEDAETADAILAHRLARRLRAAVETRRRRLGRHEEQILVDRNVALRRRAELADAKARRGGIRDVPDLEAVVVALDDVRAVEAEVGVGDAGEALLATGVCETIRMFQIASPASCRPALRPTRGSGDGAVMSGADMSGDPPLRSWPTSSTSPTIRRERRRTMTRPHGRDERVVNDARTRCEFETGP